MGGALHLLVIEVEMDQSPCPDLPHGFGDCPANLW
jgi:hypothetical protein